MMNHKINLIVCFVLIFTCLNISQTGNASNETISASQGTWSCWDDGTIDPCHNFSLYSISMTSTQDGWSVGENGAILRWNGTRWTIYQSPTTMNLNAVQLFTPNDGWIAGDDGTILHWDGYQWSTVSSPTGYDLKSIAIVTSTNAWIAGGKILHWDGNSWNQSTTPHNYSLAISMVPGSNGNDGWAVGYYGKILRWNGSDWLEFTSPVTDYLYDVEMISSTDGWIVGNNGTFLHWDGIAWSIIPVSFAGPYSSIWEITAASATDIWAIGFDSGANFISHWDGALWDISEYNFDGIEYSGITVSPGTNGSDAWVVGDSAFITHWNNISWVTINEPYTKRLHAVDMLSQNDGWIGGSAWPVSTGDAFRWNGSIWSIKEEMDTYGLDFYSGLEGTIGWSVGVWGEIYKWDGSTWTYVDSPTPIDLYQVDIVSYDEAWAVGSGNDPDHGYQVRGVIAQYQNSEWITVTLPTTTTLPTDISMLSSDNGWLVGSDGMIAQWMGSDWQVVSSPTSEDLSSIEMIDASNGWIVGANGTILHWDGMFWSPFTSPTSMGLLDVKFISSTDGWAVGGKGTIIHWNGVNWELVESPSKQTIHSIAYASPYELWAVGQTGFILHYVYSPQLIINYRTGAPGSYFTVNGSGYPANAEVELVINGYPIGSITSDLSGSINFILSTSVADEGYYVVTASVNPASSVRFLLDNAIPVRPQDGAYQIFDVPAGVAATNVITLPLVSK